MIVRFGTEEFHREAKSWCEELCGGKGWDANCAMRGYTYLFKTKAHATMFVLRFKGWIEE